MRSSVSVNFKVTGGKAFTARCEAALMNVGRATKTGTTEACREIISESLRQVPKETNTLASSAFYDVSRQQGTSSKTYQYVGVVGYADEMHDPINPKTGKPASSYAVAVHEDLSASHPVGKAKFLEDPIRAYGDKFPRAIIRNMSGF